MSGAIIITFAAGFALGLFGRLGVRLVRIMFEGMRT